MKRSLLYDKRGASKIVTNVNQSRTLVKQISRRKLRNTRK
jgi:hypothetical protein